MLSQTLRQSLSIESFELAIGKDPMIQQRYELFKGYAAGGYWWRGLLHV